MDSSTPSLPALPAGSESSLDPQLLRKESLAWGSQQQMPKEVWPREDTVHCSSPPAGPLGPSGPNASPLGTLPRSGPTSALTASPDATATPGKQTWILLVAVNLGAPGALGTSRLRSHPRLATQEPLGTHRETDGRVF